MKTIVAFIFLLLLSGCGTISKWKENRKSTFDSTAVVTTTVNTDTHTKVTDIVDTSVTVKGNSAVAVKPIEDLIKGKPITATNNETTVLVTYDSNSGTVTATATTTDRDVPISIHRTTETTGSSESTTDLKSESQVKEAVNNETTVREQKSRFWLGFALAFIIIILLIIMFVVGRFYYRRLL